MERLKIAVDFDDVLVPAAPSILDYYNATYGASVQLKDFYSEWDVPNEISIKRVDTYLRSPEYQTIQPFAEAVEALRLLSAQHDLHIVTGRPDHLSEPTHFMLDKHFPGIFKTVQFTNFFGAKPRSKAEVCQELGVDALIDDHLHHATVVAACGILTLLFGDYPWNESDDLPSGVIRTKNWQQVDEALSNLK